MNPLFSVYGYAVVPMTDDDLPSVLEVYRQCEDFLSLGPVAKASMRMVRSDIAHSRDTNGIFCTIRNSGGATVGILDIVPETGRGTAFLSLLMISKRCRNRGLGTILEKALEDYLRGKYGTTILESGVQDNNPSAIAFWKKCGFLLDGEAIDCGDGTTAFRMRKNI